MDGRLQGPGCHGNLSGILQGSRLAPMKNSSNINADHDIEEIDIYV